MIKRILILILLTISLLFVNVLFAEESKQNTKKSSIVFDDNYSPDEVLKRRLLIFTMGGNIDFLSRIAFKTFATTSAGGFEPIPNDKWIGAFDVNIWIRMNIKKGSFVHLGIDGVVKIQQLHNYSQNELNLLPLFNIESFYFQWKYPRGKIIVGRSNYFLKSTMIFNGPLDGLELDINVPFLNFKTFIGYTGLLGLFNPWFNPYALTAYDRNYKEGTNLLTPIMILNPLANQARRLFFGADFDIFFYGQHINPYFLMQYDMSSLFNNQNTENDISTFHLGVNFEGRIAPNFYYKVDLAGLFGYHPSTSAAKMVPIIACALQTELRYTIPKAAYSTFVVGYALGTGNEEATGSSAYSYRSYNDRNNNGFWADDYNGQYQNKFYYYGGFDGGYVLDPILSNIHSIKFKYIVTPVSKEKIKFSLYFAFFQTLKLYATGPISDSDCDQSSNVVGSEIDGGILFNSSYFHVGADFGVLIRESAYSDSSPIFRMGASLGFAF